MKPTMHAANIIRPALLCITLISVARATKAALTETGRAWHVGQWRHSVHRHSQTPLYQLHTYKSTDKQRSHLRFGALYYAYHKDPVKAANYVTAVAKSAASLKRHSPGVPVAVLTNADVDLTSTLENSIDIVLPIRDEDIIDGLAAKQNRQWWTRTLYLNATPFDVTIQIDSDRTICSSIHDVPELMKGYDMLLVSAGILPAFDNGVMVYKNGWKFQALLDNWLRYMAQKNKVGDDQPALALALTRTFNENGFKSGVLPPTYQMKMIPAIGEKWGTPAASHSLVLTGTVKIVAGYQRQCDLASQHAPHPRVVVSNRTYSTVVMSQRECDVFLSGRCRRVEMDWSGTYGLDVTERKEYIAKARGNL